MRDFPLTDADRAFRAALSDLGVRPTDRVVFYLTTSEASVTTYFACQVLGALAVALNFRLAPAEVAHTDRGAGVLVYEDSLSNATRTVTQRVRAVRKYISCTDSLHTGDLFSRDADGFYTFRGRNDDLIVSGGENIYPREVEEVLYQCPGVKQAAVVGLPSPRWGSVVAAFVVRSSPEVTVEAIDAFCRESPELAAFKRPRQIIFLERLPTNPSGKVIKRELMQLASEPGVRR